MIHSVQFRKARIPALALGALALAALGATALPRLTSSAPAPAPVAIIAKAPAIAFEQRPLVVQPQADRSTCGAGAYVSGDMTGDSSPAAIYTEMCPR